MRKENIQKRLKNNIYSIQVKETGRRLLELRKQAKLSQSELVNQLTSERKDGAYTTFSKTQYTRLENGEYFMSSETLMALSKYYGVSSDYILFGKKDEDANIGQLFNKNNASIICELLEGIIRIIKKNSAFN
ncbi:helix-turn-helix transcriptional regulator [Clostridium sp. WB02_MRS01]|uniref:helix-turn-helix domain-containing protein n=1 Tax=Clostridium sp. WB02_MRS01 TaxID=2605777 RepID=UPI0012B35555|nr:helix-turn-helix transcriptional regulator [Clostridium sp. WB02_MRS01]MSS11278.1 helix-turn-helix transcriptional regulator [Clostridium sp. WB02_MRS01]